MPHTAIPLGNFSTPKVPESASMQSTPEFPGAAILWAPEFVGAYVCQRPHSSAPKLPRHNASNKHEQCFSVAQLCGAQVCGAEVLWITSLWNHFFVEYNLVEHTYVAPQSPELLRTTRFYKGFLNSNFVEPQPCGAQVCGAKALWSTSLWSQ